MIGNIKKKVPAKNWYARKASFARSRVCRHCRYMLHAACNEIRSHLIVFTVYVDTVNTNKIPYSIHNNIALIFCVDHLDMPFNVHTTDKVTMMTMSGFLTI